MSDDNDNIMEFPKQETEDPKKSVFLFGDGYSITIESTNHDLTLPMSLGLLDMVKILIGEAWLGSL